MNPFGALFGAPVNRRPATPGMRLESPTMLGIGLRGACVARTAAVVSHSGTVRVDADPAAGGPGVEPLVRIHGDGEILLADQGRDVHLVDLPAGHRVVVSAASLLALDAAVGYEAGSVDGEGDLPGLRVYRLTGPGRVAVSTSGAPHVVAVDREICVDPLAVVCWSAALLVATRPAGLTGAGQRREGHSPRHIMLSGRGYVVIQPGRVPFVT